MGRFSKIWKERIYLQLVSVRKFMLYPHKPFLRTNVFLRYGCLYFEREYILICDNYDKWGQLAVFYLWVVGESHSKISLTSINAINFP